MACNRNRLDWQKGQPDSYRGSAILAGANLMARTPNHYAIHLLLAGGHHQVIKFPDLASFQQWYGNVLNAGPADAFVNVPINDLQGEYLVVRPVAWWASGSNPVRLLRRLMLRQLMLRRLMRRLHSLEQPI
jgi:hypothetical protein